MALGDPELNILYPYIYEQAQSMLMRAQLRAVATAEPTLAARGTFSGDMADAGLTWWEYMQHTTSAYSTPLSIAFAFVATHNHFVLDRGGKVFKQTAPVIKLPRGATEDEHLALLGVLNSSTACFWLKQVSHNKGEGGGARVDAGYAARGEPFRETYEFNGTTLRTSRFPQSCRWIRDGRSISLLTN